MQFLSHTRLVPRHLRLLAIGQRRYTAFRPQRAFCLTALLPHSWPCYCFPVTFSGGGCFSLSVWSEASVLFHLHRDFQRASFLLMHRSTFKARAIRLSYCPLLCIYWRFSALHILSKAHRSAAIVLGKNIYIECLYMVSQFFEFLTYSCVSLSPGHAPGQWLSI